MGNFANVCSLSPCSTLSREVSYAESWFVSHHLGILLSFVTRTEMTNQLTFPTTEADALRAALVSYASNSTRCQRDVSQALEMSDTVRNGLVSEDDRLRSAAWVLHAAAVKCLTSCPPSHEFAKEHGSLRLAADAFQIAGEAEQS